MSHLSPTTPALPEKALDALLSQIRGIVRHDPCTLGAYATDASMYQLTPAAVIEPRDRDDLLAAIRICAEHALPMLPRGGGTSLTGQSVGPCVILDTSRFLNHILEINIEERWARVEPGLVRDELNCTLAPRRLHFAPDPATSSRANIGGMIANNAAGMRSLQYGMTIDHLLSVDLALADGEVVTLTRVEKQDLASPATAPQDRIFRGLHAIIERERAEIEARFPNVPRRSGGYALDAFTGPMPWNLAKIVAGSEGTLGCILEATVRLEPLPAHSGLCLAHFQSLAHCLRAVQAIVAHGPSAVELLDGLILEQARKHPLTRHTCRMIQGAPEGLLIIEIRGDDTDRVRTQLAAIAHSVLRDQGAYAAPVMDAPSDAAAVWLMRESALGLMTNAPGSRKPTPYIEDAAVPLDVLPDYVEAVRAICAKHGQPVSLFAHAGAGLLHIRPLHDLHQREDIETMLRIQEEVFKQVLAFGGAWSGEHGDGIIRAGFNRRFFGERLYAAFRELKALFDPRGLMNPGKGVAPFPPDQNLRYGPTYRPEPISTAFQWQDDGGLLAATEQCTGIGACRKLRSGVMCPSYMATRDELHSTRGRANVLRLALSGQLGPDAMRSEEVHAIFDLCLACKGCRGECPNSVDVGKMKAELLHAYYQTHRRPLRARLFARPDLLGRLQSGCMAPLSNAVLQSAAGRRTLDHCLGIDARRPLPRYARHRFTDWFRARPRSPSQGAPVILFVDLYMEFHEPEAGQAAVQVLEAAGYRVKAFGPADSQRPAISQGDLERARKQGAALFRHLAEFADPGTPILVVEPSCATALLQDLPDLLTDRILADQVVARIATVESFLVRERDAGRCHIPLDPAPGPLSILFHPHCHQSVLDRGRACLELLCAIPGAIVRESGAGCCGMAGGFGYEKEHYDLSLQVAEDRLLPAIRDGAPTERIAAAGFSCRHQIRDLTGRTPETPLQIVAERLPEIMPD